MRNTMNGISSKAALTAVILASMTMGVNAAEPQVYNLAPVVVTATRTEESIQDVPAATEVITQKDFKQTGAYSVRSALRLAENLDLSEAGMTGNAVRIRGMDSTETLILIDGKRMAGEDASNTANVYELDRIPLSNVDRIEVVRGASSALYGSEAMGGVINIITKKPTEAGLTVGANVGTRENNNYYHYDLGQIGKFNGSFDANFSKVRQYSLNDSKDTVMFGPRQEFNFSGEYELSKDRGIGMDLGYMKEKLRSNYSDKYSGERPTRLDRYQLYNDERKSAALDYHAKTGASDFMIRAYYNQLDKDNDVYDRIKSRKEYPTPQFNSFDRATYETYVLEAKDTTRISNAHRITVGGEYRKLKYNGTRLNTNGKNPETIVINGVTRTRSETDMAFHAFYVQDEWTPNDKWLIIPAVRYDYSDKYGSYVAPKVGATYQFSDHFRFKTNYGKGFRAPSLSQLYMDSTPMPTTHIWGNPDLEPEKSLNWDAGLEGEWGKAFGKVTYFHNSVTDLIDTDPLPEEDGIKQVRYKNIHEATIQGVETEIGYHVNDHWTVKGTWNYLDAWNDSENIRLEDRSKYYGTVQLRYDTENPYGISGIFWYEYANDYFYKDSDTNNYITMGYYGLFNLSVRKSWGENLSAYVGVDNIFDREVPELYLGGRGWRTGVEWKF